MKWHMACPKHCKTDWWSRLPNPRGRAQIDHRPQRGISRGSISQIYTPTVAASGDATRIAEEAGITTSVKAGESATKKVPDGISNWRREQNAFLCPKSEYQTQDLHAGDEKIALKKKKTGQR
jgi:hypothetical protein